jgi:hypothetical protein
MKNLIPLLTLLFLVCTTQLLGQASKKTAQLLVLDKAITKIKIDVPSDQVEILHTKGSRISIETTIKISAGSLPQLDYMVKSGRYDLAPTSKITEATMLLATNKNNKVIVVKGEEIKETIHYTIHVPDHVLFVETQDGEQIEGLSSAR